MQVEKIRTMTLVAMFTAVIAVISQFSLPMPSGVPITLQTFAVALTGFLLGTKKGSTSILIYLLLGAVGIPVFSNFRGGFGVWFGPTGGFLIGFVFLTVLCGISIKKSRIIGMLLAILGVVCTHFIGTLWFMFITKSGIIPSILQISLPYLPKDIIFVITAYFCAIILKKRIKFFSETGEAK